MITFLELVIAPAILPWLLVLIADHIENIVDRKEEARARSELSRSTLGGHSA